MLITSARPTANQPIALSLPTTSNLQAQALTHIFPIHLTMKSVKILSRAPTPMWMKSPIQTIHEPVHAQADPPNAWANTVINAVSTLRIRSPKPTR